MARAATAAKPAGAQPGHRGCETDQSKQGKGADAAAEPRTEGRKVEEEGPTTYEASSMQAAMGGAVMRGDDAGCAVPGEAGIIDGRLQDEGVCAETLDAYMSPVTPCLAAEPLVAPEGRGVEV